MKGLSKFILKGKFQGYQIVDTFQSQVVDRLTDMAMASTQSLGQ